MNFSNEDIECVKEDIQGIKKQLESIKEELMFTKEEVNQLKIAQNIGSIKEITGVPDCTLTTACFDLTIFHNKSRNLKEAINNMKSLLEIPCYLVIYTDKICVDFIKEIRNSYNLAHLTDYIVTNFEDLYYYKYIDTINSNREKYWPTKDDRTCSENHLLQISKLNFVLQTIQKNPFHTTKFGWIDANLNKNCSKICRDFSINMFLNVLNNVPDKFHLQIQNVTDKKYKNKDNKREYYEKYRWVMCGAFYTMGKEIGIKILNRLNDLFIEATMLGYGHGDEFLYLEILDEFYDDIDRGYGDYGEIINNYFYPTKNIEYIYKSIIKKYSDMGYHKECYDCCKIVLYSIENVSVECSAAFHIAILYCYYISAFYHKKEVCNTIIHHIYDVCEKNPDAKKYFDENKSFYEQQFSYVIK